MSDKEEYYRLKSEELRRTQRLRDEQNFKKQGQEVIVTATQFAALAFILALLVSLSLFLVSPGALIVILFSSDLGISNTLASYWGIAAIISSALFALIALASRNLKKGAIIYISLCVAVTLASIKINTLDNRTAFKAAAEEFWPLKNQIPLFERRETSRENSHLDAKQDTKPQDAKKPDEFVVPPPQNAGAKEGLNNSFAMRHAA
jgi:hypothetical protein